MKSFFINMVFISAFSCTAPVRHYISPPEDKDTSAITPQIISGGDTLPIPVQMSITSYSLPITEWTGKNFFVLPKQKLVQSNGYDLYSCKPGACDSAEHSTDWDVKNHRIRCEKISGDTITVTAVEPAGNEWIISFVHPRSGKNIFGRTTRHALHELVLSDDLFRARKRWLHTTVFSKRGVISTIGTSPNNSISSMRVNILDSLMVNDVKWGMTPLPIKPIWLIVSTSSGKSGFIPIRFSWTNTLADHIGNTAPWDEDIFETDPRLLYDWDNYTWEVINNHRVILKMTQNQVLLSWGTPDLIKATDTDDGSERWIYPSHECLFTEGRLSLISERKH